MKTRWFTCRGRQRRRQGSLPVQVDKEEGEMSTCRGRQRRRRDGLPVEVDKEEDEMVYL